MQYSSASMSELFRECVRLAPYSQRLRALGKLWERRGRGEVPPHQRDVVIRLLKDIQIRIGEQVTPDVYWPEGRIPRSPRECLTFLQHPELFDTENYERMLWHVRWPPEGVGHPLLEAFSRTLLRLARERLVPLFVELAYVRPRDQAAAFVLGKAPYPPDVSPHCAGRAVLIGHAVEHDWPGGCVCWLHDLASLAARDVGVFVMPAHDSPTQFLLPDDDGVIGSAEESLVPAAETEGGALLAFFAGRTERFPWNTRARTTPCEGTGGRELPGSDRAVAWNYRRSPVTGDFEVFAVPQDDEGIPEGGGVD